MRSVFISLLFSILVINAKSQEDPFIDSLKTALKTSKDTARLRTLSTIISNTPNGIDWAPYNKEMGQLGLKLFKKTNDAKLKIEIARYIGDYFHGLAYLDQVQSNNKKAIANYEKSLKIKRLIRDSGGVVITLANIGAIYGDEGNYALSLDYLYESLHLAEFLQNPEETMLAFNNIANNFYEQKQNDKAIEYYKKSLAIAQKENNLQYQAAIYNNLGAVYDDMGKYALALKHYKKCLQIIKPMQNYFGFASVYNNIGSTNTMLKNYEEALVALDSSLKYATLINLTTCLAPVYHNKGRIYFETGKLNEALTASRQEEKFANESESPRLISDAAFLAYQLNKKSGDYKKAIQYHETYLTMRDSVVNEKNKKASIRKQFKYDYEKQAATDSIRNHEEQKIKNFKHEQAISKQRTYTYGGVVGFLLMLLVAIFAIRGYKQKQKANEIITAQKTEVEKQKSIIEQQKELVEEHQKEVLDSIYYAKRIQQAQLPTEKYIGKTIKRLNK